MKSWLIALIGVYLVSVELLAYIHFMLPEPEHFPPVDIWNESPEAFDIEKQPSCIFQTGEQNGITNDNTQNQAD